MLGQTSRGFCTSMHLLIVIRRLLLVAAFVRTKLDMGAYLRSEDRLNGKVCSYEITEKDRTVDNVSNTKQSKRGDRHLERLYS